MVSVYLPGNHWYEENKFRRMILCSLIVKTVSESIFCTSLVTISKDYDAPVSCNLEILIWDIES